MGEKVRFQMGIDKIIEIAVALTLIASATGKLPQVIRKVQMAEFRLLQESKTDTWGKLLIIKK
jgi:hypothetical protein